MGKKESSIGERLISARKMAGLSLQELADRLKIKISKQALNKYEKGVATPGSSMLIEISNVLNVPVDYFFRKQEVELNNIEFRKKTRLSKRDIEMIKQEAIDFLERYIELENLLNLRIVFKNPVKSSLVSENKDIERISLELRKKWRLGSDPVPDIVELFEENGIKIYEVDTNESFDGMSAIVDDILLIVINNSMPVVRRRLTLLHELAHHILDFDESLDNKQVERYCHSFAGAFLIPKKQLYHELGESRRTISIEELKFLKNYYGISGQAVVARAKFLDIISEHSYRNFNIWLNKKGLRKSVLGEYSGSESPSRFKRLLHRAVAEGVISMSKAAALDKRRLEEFRESFQVIG